MVFGFACDFRSFASTVALIALASPSAQAQAGRSAFFCQGTPGEGHYLAFAAVREIPDGDIQFNIHKWRKDGQFFGSDGIALRVGDVWIYKERGREYYIEDKSLTIYQADMKPSEPPTCKITITWTNEQTLFFDVDPIARCADSGGVGFFDKSTEFRPDEYVGPVGDELDDTDKFGNSPRCDKPKRRRAAQVLDKR